MTATKTTNQFEELLLDVTDPYTAMDMIHKIYQKKFDKTSTINSLPCRSTTKVIPDTIFFNYNRGFRLFSIYERCYDNAYYVGVSSNTIDDSTMGCFIYVDNFEKVNLVYNTLVDSLNFFYIDYLIDNFSLISLNDSSLYSLWEIYITEQLKTLLGKKVSYYVRFDFN